MKYRDTLRKLHYLVLPVLAELLMSLPAWAGWPAISAAERQFTAPPEAPGAAAVILEKQVYCNNSSNRTRYFFRIKILRSAGLSEATVQVPYRHNSMTVSDIEGRTIEPDGTIVPFTGKVRKSVMVKAGNLQVKTLEFDLPQARVGSILDYRYTIGLNGGGIQDDAGFIETYTLLPDTTWHLQGRLYIRREDYTLIPNHNYNFRMLMLGLRKDEHPVKKGYEYTLELKNVPPLPDEPFAPPKVLTRKSVEFIYSTRPFGLRNAKTYWKQLSKQYGNYAHHFIGNPKKLRRWLAGVNLSGTPDEKLQAIYARVLRIKNLYLENDVASPKENKSAQDVLKRGYGYGTDLNLTLVGLLRAAGIPAWWVRSGRRDQLGFIQSWPESYQLENDLVMAQAGNKTIYLDPAAGCPYGILLWYEDNVIGLAAKRKGGQFVAIPFQPPHDAMRQRRLVLNWQAAKTGAGGGWQGTLSVSYYGLLALNWRDRLRHRDAAGRQKEMDRLARSWLPDNARIQAGTSRGWEVGAPRLAVSWKVKLPMNSSSILWPQDIMNAGRAPALVANRRIQPIYFHYPYIHQDTIRMQLPPGAKVGSLPAPLLIPPPGQQSAALGFQEQASVQTTPQGQWLTIKRRLRLNAESVPVKFYGIVKNFFTATMQSDRQRIAIMQSPMARLQVQ